MRRPLVPTPALAPALALALVLGSGLTGCSAGGSRPNAVPASEAANAASEEVLVVLPPRPRPYWDEVTRNLAELHNLEPVAAWEMESLGEFCISYRVPSYTTAAAMAERLARDHRVRMAQPNQTFRVQGAPPDERPAGDAYLGLQHAAREMRLDEAHETATGRGVTIALVDTGVDVGHPDLRGRIAATADFVNQGEETFTSDVHGTAVAGVIAATAGNETGIEGVAPDARLLALKACWHDPVGSRRAVCSSYTLARALDAAIGSEARIVTLSLTGPDDPLLARLVERALAERIVVVAAVDAQRPDGGFPAHLTGVLAPWPSPPEAGAPPPDAAPEGALRAPAYEILTTIPRGAYDFFSGTSFATAHAAGLAALVLQLLPDATPAAVLSLIDGSARAEGGAREVDAAAAVRAAANGRT